MKNELLNVLEEICHEPIKEKLETERVIDRLEKDIETLREVESVHYYDDDKEQLANDIEYLIYELLKMTASPRIHSPASIKLRLKENE